MRFTRSDLKRFIIQESKRLLEGDVVDLWSARNLPWEFGPDGFSARGRNHEKHFSYISYRIRLMI